MNDWRSKRLLALSILLSIGAASIPSLLRTVDIFRQGHGGWKDFALGFSLILLAVGIAALLLDMRLVPANETHERKSRADELGIAMIAGIVLLVIDFVFVRPYDEERRGHQDGQDTPELAAVMRQSPSPRVRAAGISDPVVLQAIELYGRGQYLESVKRFESYLRDHDASPEIRFEYARTLFGRQWKGDDDRAIDELDQAVRARPDFAEAHSYLGWALAEHGVLKSALEHHRRAIELDAKNPAYHYQYAMALLAHRDLDDAVKELERTVEIDPENAGNHFQLGNTLMQRRQKGDLDLALAQFTEAVRRAPGYPPHQNKLGLALIEKGRYDEAIASFRQAIQADRNYSPAYYNMAVAQSLMGEKQAAATSLDVAIQLDPSYQGRARNEPAFGAPPRDPMLGRPTYVDDAKAP
jgi:tetratricopeptide (TPR) repeat protein